MKTLKYENLNQLSRDVEISIEVSPFEWVPEQLRNTSEAFRASGAIINYVFRPKPSKTQNY